MIVKQGGLYVIISHRTGKVLGRYKTKREAEDALARMKRFDKGGELMAKKLDTTEMNGVEIFEAGTWTDSKGQTDTYTIEDLNGMVQTFHDMKEKIRPFLKISHKDKSRYQEDTDLPALGWVRNMYVKGNKLVADFGNVPKTLVQLAVTGAFPRVSAEILHNANIGGKVRKWALKAVALLGANPPALDSLESIAELYSAPSVEGEEVWQLPEEAVMSFTMSDQTSIDFDHNPDMEGGDKVTEEQIKEMQDKISDLEKQNEDLSVKNAELSKSAEEVALQQKVSDITVELEKAFERGSFAPVVRDHFVAIAEALAKSDSITVKFSEKETTGLDVLKDLLSKAPVAQKFEEKMHGNQEDDSTKVEGLSISTRIDQLASEFMASNPQADYNTAVQMVFQKHPDLEKAYLDQNVNLQ